MSNAKVRLAIIAAAAAFFIVTSFLSSSAFADSQVRVVRLSEVQGDVKIDRNLGQGYEKAFLNLPITQGAKLQTKADGRAEVEFEDGSTLRITPDTVIEFPQLSLRDSGSKVSTVHLQEGIVYLNFTGAKDSELTLTFAHEKLPLTHAAHLRIDLADVTATLAVFKGDLQVEADSGKVVVSKNRTATFDLTDDDHSTIAKDLEADPFDAWDKQQDQYHQQYASNAYSNYSPYAYGTSDLNYYGSFFNAPGYGMMWQPFFAGAGWDPFMNGAWAFSPGFGYGWVSGYPWGWTPYHYGTWAYLPTYGWAWQPGGSWAAYSAPRILGAPGSFVTPQPPTAGQRTVVVNRGPVPIQLGRSFNRLEISRNSAGLGIPRGGIKNLSEVSSTVQQKGFATAKVHAASVGGGYWGGGGYRGAGGYSTIGSRGGFSSIASSAGHSSSGHSGGGHR